MGLKRQDPDRPELTGNCPIREHTADGFYVGRCDYPCYDDHCPRHGNLRDYPNRDDREVDPRLRDYGNQRLARFLREKR